VLDPDRVTKTEPTVAARDLAAGYGGPPVIERVSFEVEPGNRIGILGPNGGGKTTLFRVLLGELRPARGSLAVRAPCGYVPQTERSRSMSR
jgi:ABC-type Mn2+/Zn2+ transport system ATPase subunit